MSPGYGVPSGSTALLSISGVNRSSIPVPDGPLNDSYTGCLSDHAVRSPALLATSKIVLTFKYEWGQIGWQDFGSTGKVAGFSTVCGLPVICMILLGSVCRPGMPCPASSLVESGSSGES